jgi:two-component system response regulator PhoP
MRLLLIEDDLALQQNLYKHLIDANYLVDVASDGQTGLFQGQEYPYDAAIIDIGLPIIDGISVIKALRENDISFPILVLTARDRWQDKVSGLDAGADDYLTKPFQTEELFARLNALIRRSAGQASPLITNGELTLNTKSLQVEVNNQAVKLSSSEYKLLEYMMLHLDEVTSKAKLTEHIYDQDFDLDSNVIEVFIRRLRKKLDPTGEYGFIETLRGHGYKLKRLDVE